MKIYEEENKEVEDRECKKLTTVWPYSESPLMVTSFIIKLYIYNE